MGLKDILIDRIGIDDIHAILFLIKGNDDKKQELYDLLFDLDDRVAYQAAWTMTHFSLSENRWLYDKQDALIDEVMRCQHVGKRRLILLLLFRQPLTNPLRVDFLDFCLDRMNSKNEPLAVRTLTMKIAYELCYPYPELMQEIKTMIELMEGDLSPAIAVTKKSILSAMANGKRLQKIC